MKKNVIGVLFVISMLMCAPVRAEDASPASAPAATATVEPTTTPATTAATTADSTGTDSGSETTDGKGDTATGGVWSSLKGVVVWPWEKGQELTKDRPFASGVVLTTAAFVVMYKLCPWFREEVLGCTKKRKQTDEDLF